MNCIMYNFFLSEIGVLIFQETESINMNLCQRQALILRDDFLIKTVRSEKELLGEIQD